jgi:hypothetical protein
MVRVVYAKVRIVSFAADVALLNEVVVANVHHGVSEHEHGRQEGLRGALPCELDSKAQDNERECLTPAGHWYNCSTLLPSFLCVMLLAFIRRCQFMSTCRQAPEENETGLPTG